MSRHVPSIFTIGLTARMSIDLKESKDIHRAVGSGKSTSPEGLTIMVEQEPIDTSPDLL